MLIGLRIENMKLLFMRKNGLYSGKEIHDQKLKVQNMAKEKGVI